jgi:hypothetical protein
MDARDLTTDEVKEILRAGWDSHMADFANFSEGEMSLLLRWCGAEDFDPYGEEYDWTIRAPKRLFGGGPC